MPDIKAIGTFQFHKGTIKTNVVNAASNAVRAFQFHKGTIKTVEAMTHNYNSQTFQFHKGTIKTFLCEPYCFSFVISIP